MKIYAFGAEDAPDAGAIAAGRCTVQQAGFCRIQSYKNKKGWLCVTAQKSSSL